MRVVDASVIVKYISREGGWEKARKIIADGALTIELSIKEVANAMWKKILAGEMDLQTATKALELLKEVVSTVEQEKYYKEALKLAVEKKITFYDALYIVIAKNMDAELATADERQAFAASETGIKVIKI